MAEYYKVLGQSAPSATTLTELYVVPSGGEAIVSSLVVANRSTSTAASYRIAISPDGATLANEHYLAYDVALAAGNSAALTLGLTVNAADKILVYASNGNLSFNALGMEIV
jgi:hypothetical protein